MELTDIAAAISGAAPFSGLPEQVVENIAAAASLRRFAPGESIYSIGQIDGAEFVIVHKGLVKACSPDRATGAMIFEELAEHDVFALSLAVVGGEAGRFANMTVTAERASEVVFIDSEAFREVVAQRPSLARNLMLHFAKTLSGDLRPSSSEASPERRIFAALVALIVRDGVTQEWRIPRMPKHRELADQASADESIAANAVAQLIQSGVARRDYPGLVIDDIAALNKLAS